MTKVVIRDDVYNPVYLPCLSEMARTQIFFGGSSSGKSAFLAQRCVEDVLRGGRNYLICRQVARTLRKSVFEQICRTISEWGVSALFSINKSDMLIVCNNGYEIAFVGLDDVEKIKSVVPAKGAWTDIWIEEATETEKKSVRQLFKRQRGGNPSTPKRLTMSFNPILQTHWIYEDYFSKIGWNELQNEYKTVDLFILKTTYKDNVFLTADDRKDLENETDPYFYNVYTLGNWGILGNAIFTNWRMEDLSDMQGQFTNRKHGLDFGFSSDPAAMPCTHYDKAHKTIYVYDELYETELTNDLLAEEIKKRVGHWKKVKVTDPETGAESIVDQFSHTDLITCDSAEPKSIEELRKYHVRCQPAIKGKDSVTFGIQWLKQQTIVIDTKCINLRNELMQYKWKEDSAGRALPEPVDKNNHAIDALRYAYEDESLHREIKVIDDPFANW